MDELPSRDVFVARQPIFNRRSEVFGYELLFRSSLENTFAHDNPDQASLNVIANSFLVFGIETLIGSGRAFINFGRSTLLNNFALALPPDRLVVEVLEDVDEDDEVVEACQKLKAAGYAIALDDFDRRKSSSRLVSIADIIKIDFMATTRRQRQWIAQIASRYGAALLAEKVETAEDVQEALDLNYEYLQGYFFARPQIQKGQKLPGFRANRLELIRALHREDPDMNLIEEQFKRDPALSYQLIRHLNSAAFGLRSPITSVRRAITYLGQAGLRAWATVIVLADLATDLPVEVIVTSVTRGRFCELLGKHLKLAEDSQDLFLLGLFSLLDTLTGRPMEEALEGLPLTASAREALLGAQNPLRNVMDLVQAYEQARWEEAGALIQALGVPADVTPAAYLEAVTWGNRVRSLRP